MCSNNIYKSKMWTHQLGNILCEYLWGFILMAINYKANKKRTRERNNNFGKVNEIKMITATAYVCFTWISNENRVVIQIQSVSNVKLWIDAEQPTKHQICISTTEHIRVVIFVKFELCNFPNNKIKLEIRNSAIKLFRKCCRENDDNYVKMYIGLSIIISVKG